MNIVFMGTPDFAAESLQALISSNHSICGVFTQPDKPSGRGMKTSFSPVKELALKHSIPVFQPATYKDGDAEEILKNLAPDLLVVVAYGKILPDSFLKVASHGSINVHASLLPKYRGSSPIQWAVLNGDMETGVSIQFMAPKMDAGDVIASSKTAIGLYESSEELFERLKKLGADLLVETVDKIEQGTIERFPQDENNATYTSMLDKTMSPIDWSLSALAVIKHIYGLIPWPVATMQVGGDTLRVFAAELTDKSAPRPAGSFLATNKNGLEVVCGDGIVVRILEVQPAGKKRMPVSAYILGHPVKCDE